MNPHPAGSVEDAFFDALACCDEALAAGTPPSAPPPPGQEDRLDRAVACLRLLRRSFQPAATAPMPVITPDLGIGTGSASLGRFVLHRELGRGTLGIVFLAEDPLLGEPVVLKVLRPEVLTDVGTQRFLREARAVADFEHPNVLPVLEVGESASFCYVSSRYCEGKNLAAWLREQDQPVDPRTAAAILAPLAEALAHAHRRGLIHAALKPANILLPASKNGDPGAGHSLQPLLTDFAFARMLGIDTGWLPSGCLTGNPAYLAPEQLAGERDRIGPATDIYALGILLVELLTRRTPATGSLLEVVDQACRGKRKSPRSYRPDLPRDIERVCLRCLAQQPEARYPSADTLADDLRRLERGDPLHAYRSLTRRLWPW